MELRFEFISNVVAPIPGTVFARIVLVGISGNTFSKN
jgi:hypothetical protein